MFRTRNHVAVSKTESGQARLVSLGGPPVASNRTSETADAKSTDSLVGSREQVSLVARVKDQAAQPDSNIETATVTSAISTDALFTDLLFEFVASNNNNNQGERKVNTTINRIYRDMYSSDSICGSVVDLFSTLPFSEFTLTGLRDEKALALYTESCERCNVVRLMPHMSRDQLVTGAVLACLSWDENKKIFNGVSPQNLDNAFFTPVPVYGADPLINLEIDVNTKTYLKYLEGDARAESYRKLIPNDIIKAATGENKDSGISGIPLNPDHTMFIPRLGLMSNYMGHSLFRRALPVWLVEKAFYRGTLDQGYKRQRAITHLAIGDMERPATIQEMEAILQDFLNADADPVGAMVATRSNVQINEVRRGDDFFKWQDVYDQFSTIKMRALGTSESFISGEATYSNMEQSLSVVMDQIRSHRAQMSHEVFYMKMFPAIAKANNLTAKRYKNVEIASLQAMHFRARGMVGYVDDFGGLHSEIADVKRPTLSDFNPADYALPQVVWLKRLMPEADREYLEMLQALEEKGIPVPIRWTAAAGGINLRNLIEGAQEDLRLREQLAKIRDKVKEFTPQVSEADAEIAASVLSGFGSTAPRHLMNREYGEVDTPDLDSRGRRRVQRASYKRQRAEKDNRVIAEVAAELAKKENHKARLAYSRIEPKTKFYFRRAK